MARSSTTWQSGKTGNPAGRPKGLRDKRALLRYKLTRNLPAILKTLTDAAKGGDIQAAKLILERTLPALKSTAETLTLPGADTPASQGRTVLGACAQGDITPDEAATLMQALAAQGRLVEVEDLAQRVGALEEALEEDAPMSGLRARIIRLERHVPIGLEAELQALSDEDLETRLDELLAAMTEADVLDSMRQAPSHCHGLQERWRELQSTASPPLGQRA